MHQYFNFENEKLKSNIDSMTQILTSLVGMEGVKLISDNPEGNEMSAE